ncbi:MAG TPA: VWA domain-containing protein [Acidobacteriota bacterium]|nr:VWA domain-containing protein [Acidobacteriota bacterium]
MNRVVCFFLLFCVPCCGSFVHGLQSSSVEKPQTHRANIRVDVDLVQTDVMVFDGTGRFVEDLKRDQFELYVDGRPQPISHFEFVNAGSPQDLKQWVNPASASHPSRTESAAPVSDASRSLLFFVDDLHLSSGSVLRARKSLLQFVDNTMSANDQAAVVFASGQAGFLEQLTDNRDVLHAAVSKLNFFDQGLQDTTRPTMLESQAQAIEQNNSDVIKTFVDATMREEGLEPQFRDLAEKTVRDRATRLTRRSAELSRATLDSLMGLMRTAASIPGRKLVFLLSDGFMLHPQVSDVLTRLGKVTAAAARSGIVIYSLDTLGVSPDVPDASTTVLKDGSGRLTGTTGNAMGALRSGLYNLAAETGGRFLNHTNALEESIKESLAETSRYYVLGWNLSPELKASRKRRQLSVKIAGRPDLTVRMRQGRFEIPALTEDRRAAGRRSSKSVRAAADPLLELINAPYPGTALKVLMSAATMLEHGKEPRLVISLEVPGDRLDYSEAAGKRRALVSLLGAVLNEKGAIVTSFRQRLEAQEESARNIRPDIYYSRVVPIEPGLYQIRLAARDNASGLAGAAREWISVPAPGNRQLVLSSIFLCPQSSFSKLSAESSESRQSLDLNVGRRFQAGSGFDFVFQIYNAAHRPDSTAPDVAVTMRLYRGDRIVVDVPARPVDASSAPDPTQISYGGRFTLAGLPSGRYSFEVMVADRIANTSAFERTGIYIQ